MRYRLIIILGLLFVSTITVRAQSQPVTPEINYSEIFSTNRNARNEEIRWTFSGERVLNDFELCNRRRGGINEAEKNLLSLSSIDKATYKDLIKQKGTNLIRLLPGEKYNQGGAYYSFICKKHGYGVSSNLVLQDGSLSVGYGLGVSFILNLGDVPIESVTKDYAGLKFMFDFTAPKKIQDVRDLSLRLNAGISADGFVYRSKVPAELNQTYVLRSANYSSANVIVAFRVVGKDANGSLMIHWKQLKRLPSPGLN